MTVVEIWLTPTAAAPMRRVSSARLVAGRGLEGDRYALGGGTWAQYPDLEKQLTLVDGADVAAVAAEAGVPLTPGDTRRIGAAAVGVSQISATLIAGPPGRGSAGGAGAGRRRRRGRRAPR